MIRKPRIALVFMSMALAVGMAACTAAQKPAAPSQGAPAAKENAPATTAPQPAQKVKVRIGNLKFANYQNVWYIAKIADKYGFEVDNQVFARGVDAVEAFKAGAVDVAVSGQEAVLTTFAGGTPLIEIGSFSDGGLRLVVRKDLNIKELAALKGKKIGLARGIQDVAMKAVLKQAGIKWSETLNADAVQLVYFDQADLATNALINKLVDGLMHSEPYSSQMIQKGVADELLKPYDTAVGRWPRALIMSPKFAKEHPETAVAFVKAFVEATKYLTEHPDVGKKLTLEEMFGGKLSEADYDASMGNSKLRVSAPISQVQAEADIMLEIGTLKEKVDVTKFMKLDWVTAAAKELGWNGD